MFPQAQGSGDREVTRKGRKPRAQEKVSHHRLATDVPSHREPERPRKCAGREDADKLRTGERPAL